VSHFLCFTRNKKTTFIHVVGNLITLKGVKKMRRRNNTEVYEKSNKVNEVPNLNLSKETKTLYSQFREQTQLTTKNLQCLADSICKDLDIARTDVLFDGRQPHRNSNGKLRQKTMGIYQPFTHKIQVYKFTAKRKQVYAPKSAISTLLHEINHHIDYMVLCLAVSLHTGGFYRRLKHITESIK
jgi:Mg2+ and Co2+ transporter CorA